MMLAQKSGPQIAAKVGNPAGLLCRRMWYSVGKSGVLGITEYRQGRPLIIIITGVVFRRLQRHEVLWLGHQTSRGLLHTPGVRLRQPLLGRIHRVCADTPA